VPGHGRDIGDLVASRPRTKASVAYARRAHDGQRRSVDGAPFIEHPLEVAKLLQHAGAADHVIAAGVLHDVIEKAGADPSELERRFGPEVTTLVRAVTEDPSITGYSRRKAALRRQAAAGGDDAMAVFAADKISKVRELRLGPDAEPRTRRRRLSHYRASLRMLEARIGRSPLVTQLAGELQQLSGRASVAVPPSSAASRSHVAI
jgi:(p)ppGpp synthase/HD superfamily hydrolase